MPEEQVAASTPQSAPSSSLVGTTPTPGGSPPESVSQPSSQSTQPATSERPSWVPDDFWDDTSKQINGDGLRKSFDDLRAFKAQEEVKAATRPKTPEEYKVALPDTFKPPEGIEFKFREDDPLMVQARAWAHKSGMDQETFSQALELYAGAQIGTQSVIKQAREAEVAKLGTTGPALIDNTIGWFKSMIGDEGAKSIASMMVTADIVQALAKVVTKFANQGAGSYSQSGRDGGPRTPSDEEWNKMTYHQKADYQRQASARANGQGR